MVVDKKLNMVSLHRALRVDLLCKEVHHRHVCDRGESSNVGPILTNPGEKKNASQPIFFFAHHEPLNVERFEVHKSKSSPVADSSFIYMLETKENLEVTKLEDYFTEQTYVMPPVQVSELEIESLVREESA